MFCQRFITQNADTFCPYETGVISVLANVRQFDDLGHPLCRNLRDGDWMMDYTVARLLPFVGTRQVSNSVS